jgi:hypothetical protein
MAAQVFHYDEDWKSALLNCPKCGWQGTFEEGDVEFYSQVMDSHCPKCQGDDSPMLAIVSLAVPPMEGNS